MNKTYAFSDVHGVYNLWEQIRDYCDETDTIYFLGDGNQIGDPITFTKTSKPLDIEIDVEGINDFKIIFDTMDSIYISNEGFYQ